MLTGGGRRCVTLQRCDVMRASYCVGFAWLSHRVRIRECHRGMIPMSEFGVLGFPSSFFWPKTLVLFLHTATVPEATGKKMAPKRETIVTIHTNNIVRIMPSVMRRALALTPWQISRGKEGTWLGHDYIPIRYKNSVSRRDCQGSKLVWCDYIMYIIL